MQKAYSLDDYADDIEKYIIDNGIYGTAVVAHSFGARIVLKLCKRKGDIFSKIIITGGAGLKPKRKVKYCFKKTAFNILKPFVSKERLKGFYSPDYLALNDTMRQSFKMIINEHLDDNLSSVTVPTLLIYGKDDKETPIYMAKRFKKGIKNSALKVYKDCGHFCFIDKPYKFNREVREFLLSNN